jgi:nucleoside-diphosphate-sugar epimerase
VTTGRRLVAVTGAAGFVGRPLCRLLVARGFTVRALVRDPIGADLGPGVIAGRCILPDEIDETHLAGADVLVHAAWATRETDPERARRVNEDGARRLVELATRHGVPRRVFVSSIAARDDAPSRYGRSKRAMERLFAGPNDLVLRPGLVLAASGHGLFQQLLGAARRFHVVPIFRGGRQPVQTVHIDDLCAGIVAAIERRLVGTVAVAERDPIAMKDFLHTMARLAGLRCVLIPLPFRPVLAALRTAERAGIALPLRSESLLGLSGMQQVAVDDDLARLGVPLRSARESLRALLAQGSITGISAARS